MLSGCSRVRRLMLLLQLLVLLSRCCVRPLMQHRAWRSVVCVCVPWLRRRVLSRGTSVSRRVQEQVKTKKTCQKGRVLSVKYSCRSHEDVCVSLDQWMGGRQ